MGSFDKLFASYKTYDPATEGFGNPDEWKAAFRERVTLGEAHEILRGKNPRAILGVSARATKAEITKAWRRKMLEVHPDRIRVTGLSPEQAHRLSKEAVAAYTILIGGRK